MNEYAEHKKAGKGEIEMHNLEGLKSSARNKSFKFTYVPIKTSVDGSAILII